GCNCKDHRSACGSWHGTVHWTSRVVIASSMSSDATSMTNIDDYCDIEGTMYVYAAKNAQGLTIRSGVATLSCSDLEERTTIFPDDPAFGTCTDTSKVDQKTGGTVRLVDYYSKATINDI